MPDKKKNAATLKDLQKQMRESNKTKRGFIEALTDIEEKVNSGEFSDGYHTFNELYEARSVLHAYAVQLWDVLGYEVIKSKRHSDGKECFGGGWFIVVASIPRPNEGNWQVSFHYPMQDWDRFKVPVSALAPEWDGAGPLENLRRLRVSITSNAIDSDVVRVIGEMSFGRLMIEKDKSDRNAKANFAPKTSSKAAPEPPVYRIRNLLWQSPDTGHVEVIDAVDEATIESNEEIIEIMIGKARETYGTDARLRWITLTVMKDDIDKVMAKTTEVNVLGVEGE